MTDPITAKVFWPNGPMKYSEEAQKQVRTGIPTIEPIDLYEQTHDTTEYYIAVRDGVVLPGSGLVDSAGTPIFLNDILLYTKKTRAHNEKEWKDTKVTLAVRFGIYQDGEGYGDNEHYGWYCTDPLTGYNHHTLPDIASRSIVIGNMFIGE